MENIREKERKEGRDLPASAFFSPANGKTKRERKRSGRSLFPLKAGMVQGGEGVAARSRRLSRRTRRKQKKKKKKKKKKKGRGVALRGGEKKGKGKDFNGAESSSAFRKKKKKKKGGGKFEETRSATNLHLNAKKEGLRSLRGREGGEDKITI